MFDKQFRLKTDGTLYSEYEFRTLFPNKSLPSPILQKDALENSADLIVEVPQPAFNSNTHTARVDGVELVDGSWSWKWVVEAKPDELVAADLENGKNALIRQIDTDVDSIYGVVMGNRGSEYTLAEQEALAYQATNYTGDIPLSVGVWANAKGETATWAANDIIATAMQWRGAQMMIRENRLKIKESARAATTFTKLASAKTQWNSFTATVRGALGL